MGHNRCIHIAVQRRAHIYNVRPLLFHHRDVEISDERQEEARWREREKEISRPGHTAYLSLTTGKALMPRSGSTQDILVLLQEQEPTDTPITTTHQHQHRHDPDPLSGEERAPLPGLQALISEGLVLLVLLVVLVVMLLVLILVVLVLVVMVLLVLLLVVLVLVVLPLLVVVLPEKKFEALQGYLAEHNDQIRLIVRLVIAAGFVAIVIVACVLNFNRAVEMLVISLVTVIFLAWDWMMKRYGDRVCEELSPIRDVLGRNWFWIRWVVYVSLLGALVGWLALDTAKRGSRQLVMPILVFISSVISILFYVGFMPWLVGKTESPLLIRPYISELTCSEIHAVMTAGFASVSGSVLGAYISFGVRRQ
ncbi:Solute carrier family 28 member 3 [Liparis tanakae]|uniref:Solute carrier family 28 member 3 n=1 Tax=Liparis tanakae TaxID=230148 RepID=A0A4Z2ITX9_9TELE|nr:Solute carrier family 28 member 3 [Liparis tanakae]